MQFIIPIKITFRNLMATKFRSFLTILGIIIGIAAVIIIMSIGRSAQDLIVSQIQGLGSNLIGILPGASDEDGPPAAVLGISVTTLTYDDLQAIKKVHNAPAIEEAAGYVLGTATTEYRENELSMPFIGTTASYIDVENVEVATGRFFNESEERGLGRVAVLGHNAVEDLFGEGSNPLNKKIKLDDQSFTIIGVMKERGSVAFGASSTDDSIMIPVRTAQKLLLGINHLGFIRAKARSNEQVERAIEQVKVLLRDRHDIDDPENDDFSVRDQASALETIGNITDVMRYFLLAVGGLSLIVGGVGIMNIMLIAVNQRIREIGLRKSVGAKNKDVAIQFLIESSFVTFLGGIIGIILGVLISFIISKVVQAMDYDWIFFIDGGSIIVASIVAIFIGIIFGIYPAYKATRVSPMEALRYE